MAHDVFISYSSQDENVVRAVSHALEAEKIRCWYASRDITPGSEWATSIVDAIQNAKALLLIFTDFSNASQMVLKEINTAIDFGKPVIPFKLTSNRPTGGMQFYLNSVHWLDAVDQPLEDAIAKLVCRVKQFVPADEAPTPSKPDPTPPVQQPKPGPSPFVKWLVGGLAVVVLLFAAIRLWPFSSAERSADAPAASPVEAPADTPSAPGWKGNVLAADVLLTERRDAAADEAVAADSSPLGLPLKRSEVGSVTFLDSVNGAPEDARDVSAANDQSVLAWAKKDQNGLYDLCIAGAGGVAAPADCSGLFQGYTHVRRIDFGTAFHTDDTTNMRQMFAYCAGLDGLDLSGFDTAHVTDMSNMFCQAAGLRRIAFGGGFDTSRVGDMTSMFFGCEQLEQLDVSGFDTASCTSMHGMFYHCSRLAALDVSGFDTSRVTAWDSFLPDRLQPNWRSLFAG